MAPGRPVIQRSPFSVRTRASAQTPSCWACGPFPHRVSSWPLLFLPAGGRRPLGACHAPEPTWREGLSRAPTCAGQGAWPHVSFNTRSEACHGADGLLGRGRCGEACLLSAPWLLTHSSPPLSPPPVYSEAAAGVWLQAQQG